MAVTLIDEIRAAEKTAEEIREAAVDEAREIAKRAQAALAEWERAEAGKTREAVAQRLREAQKRAEADVRAIETRRSAERQALKQVAQGRVSRAAQSIFERIAGHGNR